MLLRTVVPLLALVLSSCGGSVVACDCAFPLLSFVAPANGTSNVPRTARIWLGAQELMDAGGRGGEPVDPQHLPAITAETQAGEAIALHVGYLGDRQNGVAVVRPDSPLTPGESYEVKVEGRLVTFFAAGDEAATAGCTTAAGSLPAFLALGLLRRRRVRRSLHSA